MNKNNIQENRSAFRALAGKNMQIAYAPLKKSKEICIVCKKDDDSDHLYPLFIINALDVGVKPKRVSM
jgi:hypothetical protein